MRHALVLLAAVAASLLLGAGLITAAWHLGYLHALYCAIGNAATDGCDVTPRTGAGQVVAVVVILVTIPLFGLLVARVTSVHVDRLWRRRNGADIAQIRETAEKAHRIAADTHRALTGLDHPDAPPPHTTEEP